MLKLIMKIVLTPFMLVARLMLGLAAFITSIASTIIGLTVTVLGSRSWCWRCSQAPSVCLRWPTSC